MQVVAVRPQEGWYVRDIIQHTVGGVTRDYFVIDNKMSADPWYINFYTFQYVLPDPLFMSPNWNEKGMDVNWNVLGLSNTVYRGFSDVDWSVDDDWLCLIEWDGVSFTSSAFDFFNVLIFDKSKTPLLIFDNGLDSYGIHGPVDAVLGRSWTEKIGGSPFSQPSTPFSGSSGSAVIRLGGTYQSDAGGLNMLLNPFFSTSTNATYSFYSVDGTSINDLCVIPFARGFQPVVGSHDFLNIRLAICWAIPVDKAPSGTQVGDSWPKQRPLEVQMDDAYSAWMDAALQNTPYGDASNVGSGIQDYNKQLEESDNWGSLATEGWNSISVIFDSFDFIFTVLAIVGVSFILLLLIKKGMA